ncbi:acetate--CoA ligase [Melghirimyces algeriensis]|uniref:acetate--CoA ligase n=1 Tax=Melghirimyces algeriensis TaxID=910412 RepID=A0A521DH85_9BACL|nr:acetate--CoA ligase [Melghirimyces algeriensis]SMO70945.1 acetyl-CoA synthetase [Melghirimyces algeriensis]
MKEAVWFPKEDRIKRLKMYQLMKKNGMTDYDQFYQHSVQKPSWFWETVIKDLDLEWFQPYQQVLDTSKGIPWSQWFAEGKINVAHNCLDRFVKDPVAKNRTAIIWEGDNGDVRKLTYQELCEEVQAFARGLQMLGVNRGDRIAIYLPMIVENVIAMLAVARIGAIFIPCFSGYGAEAVATRLQDCEAKVLVTADGFFRRGKVIRMKEEADQAADQSPSVEKVVVVSRLNREDCPRQDARDVDWDVLTKDKKALSSTKTDANEPFMIIYTSGTTGRPKGTIHSHSGFPVKAAFDAGYSMDLGAGDTLFWMTDMGWMMGPWMVFGSLLNGSTMLLFEGTPDYPKPDRLWKIVDNHRVTHLGISPTVIRALMKFGDKWLASYSLDTLRVFGSTGEPWNPEPWSWLFEKVGKKEVPIWNYSGGTEISGGILSSNLMKPISPCSFNGPMPGMDAEVVDEKANPVRGEVGELVIRQPWVGMANGFWKDPDRYEQTYWNRWPDLWVHGDWVQVDADGYWYITGRSDDTLKIAGKRLGPAEVESILVDHPAVLESATIGVPDSDKGEAAICFAVLKPDHEESESLKEELMKSVAERLGKALKPKAIHFVKELPKTRNGKILRRVMKSAYTGKAPGDLSSLENPMAVKAIQQCSPD